MSMKIVYSMAVIICAAMWFGSCQNEELDYYPLEKKHLGETYTEYVMNNIISNDTVSRIALNFYPEEVTSLSYVDYDESTCIFTFTGETLPDTGFHGIMKPMEATSRYNTDRTACGIP